MASKLRLEVNLGDCVEGMLGQPKGCARLACVDPPYNQGAAYDAYDDRKSHAEYMDWTRSWMAAVRHVLHKHGSFWLFVPDEWVSELDVMAKREFKFTKRRHIVWYFTFGVACQKNFSRSHCHVLYYTATKTKYTFNADAIRVKSARQAVYNDPRQNPKGKLPDATWVLLRDQLAPYMKPDQDVWLENRICGTYHERRAHCPNQIPIPLMERIVRSTSDRGDLVVDPFAGTGSLGEACRSLDRSYLGYDVSTECVKQVRKRLGLTPAKKTRARQGA